MAYDLHIALHEADAAQSDPSWSLPEELHDLLFLVHSPLMEPYPLLLRMSDFYADSLYTSQELQDLLQEINSLIAESANKEVESFAFSLRELCLEAIEQGANLYGISD